MGLSQRQNVRKVIHMDIESNMSYEQRSVGKRNLEPGGKPAGS